MVYFLKYTTSKGVAILVTDQNVYHLALPLLLYLLIFACYIQLFFANILMRSQ